VGKTPLPAARGGSSSPSRAPNPKSSPSTRPRLQEDNVLLTCGGENGRRKASNVEVARAYYDGDGGAWQWRLGLMSIGTGKTPFYRGVGVI
jgi:hypothetical protein